VSTEGMDTRELDDLVKNMFRTAQDVYPDEAKSFLKKEGNKGRRLLRAKTKAVTKKKTGNLLKGIRRTGVQKHDGDFQIRVYNKAPHAHLIEHGHVLWVNGTKTEKFVPGKHPAADTTKQLKREFPRDVEGFVDEMLSKGFEL
jgi:hypothetical protein